MSAAPKNKGYKRSWKNYILDKNYQLRFTFYILVVAAGFMAPMGWWVSQKATAATEVAINKLDGAVVDCPAVLFPAPPEDSSVLDTPVDLDDELLNDSVDDDGAEVSTEDSEVSTEDMSEVEGGMEKSADRTRPKIEVDIDVVVGQMHAKGPNPSQIANSKKLNKACLAAIEVRKEAVRKRQSLITMVLFFSALLLMFGLAIYGIVTTHKVAGPLFKVGLYLGKLQNNIYDTVYNLRKGDQLMGFYEHFKGAHAGLTTLQRNDCDRLRDAIALAKEAGLTDIQKCKSKEMEVLVLEMATLVEELEAMLAEKEESLGENS